MDLSILGVIRQNDLALATLQREIREYSFVCITTTTAATQRRLLHQHIQRYSSVYRTKKFTEKEGCNPCITECLLLSSSRNTTTSRLSAEERFLGMFLWSGHRSVLSQSRAARFVIRAEVVPPCVVLHRRQQCTSGLCFLLRFPVSRIDCLVYNV